MIAIGGFVPVPKYNIVDWDTPKNFVKLKKEMADAGYEPIWSEFVAFNVPEEGSEEEGKHWKFDNRN